MRLIATLLFATWSTVAIAAGPPVYQSGNVTPGHVPMWTANGILQDGGTAAYGFLTSIGVTAQGPAICQNSAPITQPYNQICLSVSTGSAASITLQNYGGAIAQSLNFKINGTTYNFPYTVGGIVGPSSSTVGDIAAWNNSSGSLLLDTGVSYLNLPLLNGTNTFSGSNTFSGTSNCTGTCELNGTAFGTFATQNYASPPIIGGSVPNSATFTALIATSLNSTSIGATTPGTGAFTTLSASSTVSGTGFTNLFASPPAIGGTSPNTGKFTSLTDTGIASGNQCVQAGSSGSLSGVAAPCVLLSGNNSWSGSQYFGSGSPWADIKSGSNGCAAAIGNNSNDDTSAIQCQITYMNTTFGAGIVYVPCGNYHITSTITVPGAVKLLGGGVECSFIQANNGSPIVVSPMFDFTGDYGGMEKIFVFNDNGGGATGVTVHVEATAIGSVFRDCQITGGNVALEASGTDGVYDNCFINAGTNGSASVYSHGTTIGSAANWYIRDKIDDTSGTVTYAVLIDTTSGATAVMENHFVQSDMSGYSTASMRIDDSNEAAVRTAITVVESSVLALQVQIISHRLSSFVANEFGENFSISAGASSIALSGNLGQSSITATGASCAANVNVTC